MEWLWLNLDKFRRPASGYIIAAFDSAITHDNAEMYNALFRNFGAAMAEMAHNTPQPRSRIGFLARIGGLQE
jgi:hypothetical protein